MDFRNKHENQAGRGLTGELWKGFPSAEIFTFRDRSVGYGVMPELEAFDSAVDAAVATVRYAPGARIYVDASSTIKQIPDYPGGGIRLFNTADNEECWIQWGGDVGAPFVISDSSGRDLIAEWAFRLNTITDDKAGFFIGLAEAGLAAADTISDAGAMADKDFIGFLRSEGDGDAIDFVYNKAGAGGMTTVKADWQTIAADTWYHVGLRFSANGRSVVPYFGTGDRSTTKMAADTDNKVSSTDIAAATFPDGEALAPLLGGKNASADDAYMDIRLMGIGQLAAAAD